MTENSYSTPYICKNNTYRVWQNYTRCKAYALYITFHVIKRQTNIAAKKETRAIPVADISVQWFSNHSFTFGSLQLNSWAPLGTKQLLSQTITKPTKSCCVSMGDSIRPWGVLTWNAKVYIHSVLSVERRRVVICVKTSTHIGLKHLLQGQFFTSLATFSIQPLMMWKGVEALRTVQKNKKDCAKNKNITFMLIDEKTILQ